MDAFYTKHQHHSCRIPHIFLQVPASPSCLSYSSFFLVVFLDFTLDPMCTKHCKYNLTAKVTCSSPWLCIRVEFQLFSKSTVGWCINKGSSGVQLQKVSVGATRTPAVYGTRQESYSYARQDDVRGELWQHAHEDGPLVFSVPPRARGNPSPLSTLIYQVFVYRFEPGWFVSSTFVGPVCDRHYNVVYFEDVGT